MSIDLSPEDQRGADALMEAMEVFQRATEPWLKRGGSALIKIEFKGVGHCASIVQEHASPEIVLMGMIQQKGAQQVLSEILGKNVHIAAVPMPKSEMLGERSFIHVQKFDEDGLPEDDL